MNRRTDTYKFLPRTFAVAEGTLGGFVAWRPTGFNIACNQNQKCGAIGTQCPAEEDVSHVWEPRIIQYGLSLYEPKAGATLVPTESPFVQCLLSFLPESEVRPIVDNPPAIIPSPVVSQLDSIECGFPIAGWYSGVGDQTPRQSYGTNNGNGYLFPRQYVGPQEACAKDKGYDYLVCTWRYPAALLDVDKPGCLRIDWEWQLREL